MLRGADYQDLLIFDEIVRTKLVNPNITHLGNLNEMRSDYPKQIKETKIAIVMQSSPEQITASKPLGVVS